MGVPSKADVFLCPYQAYVCSLDYLGLMSIVNSLVWQATSYRLSISLVPDCPREWRDGEVGEGKLKSSAEFQWENWVARNTIFLFLFSLDCCATQFSLSRRFHLSPARMFPCCAFTLLHNLFYVVYPIFIFIVPSMPLLRPQLSTRIIHNSSKNVLRLVLNWIAAPHNSLNCHCDHFEIMKLVSKRYRWPF